MTILKLIWVMAVQADDAREFNGLSLYASEKDARDIMRVFPIYEIGEDDGHPDLDSRDDSQLLDLWRSYHEGARIEITQHFVEVL